MVKTNSNCFFLQPPRLVSTKQYLNFRRIEFNPHYYEHLDKSNDLYNYYFTDSSAVTAVFYFICLRSTVRGVNVTDCLSHETKVCSSSNHTGSHCFQVGWTPESDSCMHGETKGSQGSPYLLSGKHSLQVLKYGQLS